MADEKYNLSDDFIAQAAGDVQTVANAPGVSGYEQRQLLSAASLMLKIHARNTAPVQSTD